MNINSFCSEIRRAISDSCLRFGAEDSFDILASRGYGDQWSVSRCWWLRHHASGKILFVSHEGSGGVYSDFAGWDEIRVEVSKHEACIYSEPYNGHVLERMLRRKGFKIKNFCLEFFEFETGEKYRIPPELLADIETANQWESRPGSRWYECERIWE